jgi:hypothetical protein
MPKAPSTGDVIAKVREAREKAHYQAAETRDWGSSSLIDSLPTPPPVDWKQVPDPNK